MSVVAYVAFGSNVGPRDKHLENARCMLLESFGVESLRLSSWIETEPAGSAAAPASGGKYLNGVAEVTTTLSAVDLLRRCLECEDRLGRVRRQPNDQRPIDLDLLLYADSVLDLPPSTTAPALVVPHPRMLERAFVLEPLAELAPDVVHPVTGKTIGAHLEEVRGQGFRAEERC